MQLLEVGNNNIMMTRKDYVEVARILNKYKDVIDEKDYTDLTDDFSYMFEQDNPRFDSSRFLIACNESVVK